MSQNFVPCLLDFDGNFYGMLGGFTRLRDCRGKRLRVGDTVRAVHQGGQVIEETPIIFPNDGSPTGCYASVYGISDTCAEDGSIFGGWMITKIRGVDEIPDSETINPHPQNDPRYAITYCKTEP